MIPIDRGSLLFVVLRQSRFAFVHGISVDDGLRLNDVETSDDLDMAVCYGNVYR